MAAVSTLDVDGPHVFLHGRVVDLGHASVLPRVLTGSQEEDVLSLDIEASKVLVGLLHSREFDVLGENSLAVVNPELGLERLRAHRVLVVRDLEPCELGAVLVGPLSNVLVDVNGGVSESHGVIFVGANTLLNGVCAEGRERIVGPLNALDELAHLSSGAVLDSHSKDIGNIEHEVTLLDVHVGVAKLSEHLFFLLFATLKEDSIDVLGNFADALGALITRVESGDKDVKVKVREVLYGIYNA